MPKFSESSQEKLKTCDKKLQKLFNEVIKHFDCTITEGHRTPQKQLQYYNRGQSKTTHGKHNESPSLAVDALPCPVDYNNLDRIRYFAGFVMGIAAALKINIRWGGDWDKDTELRDNSFNDLVHFELI